MLPPKLTIILPTPKKEKKDKLSKKTAECQLIHLGTEQFSNMKS